MKLAEEMSLEEIKLAAAAARKSLSDMIGEEVPPTVSVVYQHKSVAMKMVDGVWWVMVYGTEPATGEASITLLPFSVFFHNTNSILAYVAQVDGPDAAVKFLAEQGMDVSFVSDDDVTGETPHTLN